MLIKRISGAALVLASLLLFFDSADAQKSRKNTARNNGARAVLWEPVNVSQFDTFYGTGGQSMQPDLSRIRFIRQEKGGYSTKYRIEDGAGRVWVAKVGKEAQSETAAVRLLSSLGYKTEIVYLVPRLTIPGKGTFSNVRLEARPAGVERGDPWQWSSNPFNGTNQLQGLKIMMAMINNWDMKSTNNVVFETPDRHLYAISDLGATFGKMGATAFPLFRWIGRSRNNPSDYARSKFVRGVDRNRVKLSFNGKNNGQLSNITLGNARWLSDLLGQLSERQIRDAFRAANYTPAQVDLLTRAFRDRVAQLDRASAYRMAGTR